MKYPAKRTITWHCDDTTEELGRCDYIRKNIVDDLVRALEEINVNGIGDIATDALETYSEAMKLWTRR